MQTFITKIMLRDLVDMCCGCWHVGLPRLSCEASSTRARYSGLSQNLYALSLRCLTTSVLHMFFAGARRDSVPPSVWQEIVQEVIMFQDCLTSVPAAQEC